MRKAGRREGTQRIGKARSTFRIVIVCLFAILGGGVFGSFAVPVLNILSVGVTRLMVPHGGAAQTDIVPVGSKNPLKPARLVRSTQGATTPPSYTASVFNIVPFALLGAILGGFVGTLFLNGLDRLGRTWDRMELGDKVNYFIGSIAGLFLGIQFLGLFQGIELSALSRTCILIALIAVFAALTILALQSMSEVLPWSRMRGKVRRSGIKIMDTNVIIDGRIYDIAKTGFLDGQLYVPGFVLDELQYIADSHDQLRRQRGRRGLEVLRHMQADFPLDTHVHDKLAPDMQDGVDARLVRLAKAVGGDILTNDFNLKRVAELQDVHVLSLNDLALALRPNVLPLETLSGLKIIKEGNQFGQGVGYLEDGTMVVVENGYEHIGETRDVTVTQVIQTERGKMIFAELENPDQGEHRTSRRRRSGLS